MDVSTLQILVVGAAALAILIGFAPPRDYPVPRYVWVGLGVLLIIVSVIPISLLLVVLGVAFALVLRGFRRQY